MMEPSPAPLTREQYQEIMEQIAILIEQDPALGTPEAEKLVQLVIQAQLYEGVNHPQSKHIPCDEHTTTGAACPSPASYEGRWRMMQHLCSFHAMEANQTAFEMLMHSGVMLTGDEIALVVEYQAPFRRMGS